MKKLYSLLACLFVCSYSVYAQVGQGAIQGKIVDKESGEPLPFANVSVEIDGNPAGGSTTDFDGKYSIKPLSPGEYTVKASYVGYQTVQYNNVKVTSNQSTFLDMNMGSDQGVVLEDVIISDYEIPLIEKDNNTQGGRIGREQFARMPTRDIATAASLVPGTVSDPSGGTSIRGSRGSANQTFIDGIKVRGGTNLPRAAIEEIQVLTGGIPAEVGDITGGATFVTTRGATVESFGALELLSSGFGYKDGNTQKTWGLDNQGYNLAAFTYGGPILRKKDEKGVKKGAIISFIVTSEIIHQVDPRPSMIGTYKISDDKLAELKARPYMTPAEIGGGTGLSGSVLRSEYDVRSDDMEIVETRQNASNRQINLQTNFTVNTSKNTSLRFGGTYYNQQAENYQGGNALYNYENNPLFKQTDWRVYGRFTQRFANPLDEEGNETKSNLRNAYVSIQVDYQQAIRGSEHQDHGDELFKYGYVGRFERVEEKSYELGQWEGVGTAFIHNGFNQTNWNYTYNDLNPDLANYTRQYYDLYKDSEGNPQVEGFYDNINNVQTFTIINGADAPSVYGLWAGHGQSAVGFSKSVANQFRLTASGAADYKAHEIKLGFEFEQRLDRGYGMNRPQELWNIGRQQMNSHIAELDSNSATVEYINGVPYVSFERWYRNESGGLLGDGQFVFDYRVRQALGLNPSGNDFVDFDNYDPTNYKIDYFSADDLINNNSRLGLSYFGYDYKGNKQSGSPSLDDFFNETDEFGRKTRPIDAFRPIYAAGYIQDKFTFNDLIFRVGLRVDYFDANQPVLKDQYSLFPTISASEVNSAGVSTPGNIGSDYIVYVNANNSGISTLTNGDVSIIGYRNPEDNTWYDANGVLVGRAEALTGGSGNPFPLLQNPENTSSVEDLNSSSFEDYKPQINPMPRISFSFPISDEASFFANYDVLVSRPTAGLQFRPTDYLFLGSTNRPINNPNLLPEKTITYELGFKQALTRNTAISISAFYREMRDQIQVFRFDGAYPVTYTSFENLDFGTVTGFTLAYDLRRVKNIALTANYTLQFAKGTGSNSESQFNLVNANRPNLRNISALDYDQRNNFNLNFDYHYGYGKNYNGPKIKNKDVLSNAGFNIIGRASSGAPYTKLQNVVGLNGQGTSRLEGDVNGSRLPWSFSVDARVDKRFRVEYGSKSKDNRKFAWMEVYFQILNLLNTQNIVGVYEATGNPDDDGYLSSSIAQPVIQSSRNPASFVDHYEAALLAETFYSIQRRVRLGLVIEF